MNPVLVEDLVTVLDTLTKNTTLLKLRSPCSQDRQTSIKSAWTTVGSASKPWESLGWCITLKNEQTCSTPYKNRGCTKDIPALVA